MKKILFATLLVFASVMAYAQPRAIGVRLGEFDGFSYQHSVGDNNMFEFEAGFNWGNYWGNRMVGWINGNEWHLYGHNVQVAFTYDWIDPFGATFPTMPKGEWHWYMGVGAAGGYGWYGYVYDRNLGAAGADENWGFVGATGRIGVEYDFWFPLQLSLDFRPTLGAGLAETYNAYDAALRKTVDAGLYYDLFGLCLGVRYKF